VLLAVLPLVEVSVLPVLLPLAPSVRVSLPPDVALPELASEAVLPVVALLPEPVLGAAGVVLVALLLSFVALLLEPVGPELLLEPL
jgi:hypothetical protein